MPVVWWWWWRFEQFSIWFVAIKWKLVVNSLPPRPRARSRSHQYYDSFAFWGGNKARHLIRSNNSQLITAHIYHTTRIVTVAELARYKIHCIFFSPWSNFLFFKSKMLCSNWKELPLFRCKWKAIVPRLHCFVLSFDYILTRLFFCLFVWSCLIDFVHWNSI